VLRGARPGAVAPVFLSFLLPCWRVAPLSHRAESSFAIFKLECLITQPHVYAPPCVSSRDSDDGHWQLCHRLRVVGE
jgi:hypothetical protein